MIKFGLVGLTKYFATLFAAGGVTCNTLSPGAISHKQSKSFKKSNIQEPYERLAKRDDLISTLLYMLDENQVLSLAKILLLRRKNTYMKTEYT